MTSRTLPSNSFNFIQDCIYKNANRFIRDIPPLNSALIKRARNCMKRSDDNNDLLEFIGDRAVNLLLAIMTDEVKLNSTHHTAIRSTVCSNDTFGRLAYYFRFHHHAKLDKQDTLDIDAWDSLSNACPPKVLGDLFEAYAGAVYIQHGWSKLSSWLNKVFQPIIKAATGDFWTKNSAERILGYSHSLKLRIPVPETRTQSKLLDYVEFKREKMLSDATDMLAKLPRDTTYTFDRNGRLVEPHCDSVEVAIHLINMWICQIVIQMWPEYHTARAKAAHMLTAITGLVVSERVIAFLASILSLDSRIRFEKRGDSALPTIKPTHRAVMFKATIGCVYHEDPDGVRAWGEIWLRPIVVRAHDILVDLQGYRPLISGVHPSVSTDSVSITQEEQDDISSLVSGLDALVIKGQNDTALTSRSQTGKQNPVEKKDLEKSQPSSRHSSGKMRIILRSFTPPPARTPSPSDSYEQHDDLSKALASMSITDQASRRSSPNTSERARQGFSEESKVEAKHNAKPVRVQQLSGAVGSLNLHHNDRSRSFSNAEGCAQAGKWCPIGEQSLNTTKVNVKVSGTNEPSNMSTDSVPSKLKKSHSIQNMPSSTKDKENCRDHIVQASSTPTDIVSEPTPQAKTYGGRISDCHDEDGPDNVTKKTETKLVSSQLQSQLKVTMFLPRAVSNKGRQRGAVSEHNPLRRFN